MQERWMKNARVVREAVQVADKKGVHERQVREECKWQIRSA